jgi:uncharacterized protein (DUF885 family)
MRPKVTALLLVPLIACGEAPDPAASFDRLVDEVWEFELREDPVVATQVGDHRYDDRLPDVSDTALARRTSSRRAFIQRLDSIDRGRLSRQRQITYTMLRDQLAATVAEYEFGSHQMPILADDGFHIAFAQLPSQMPFASVDDYERYIARLRAFPGYVQQQIAQMRAGLASGFSMPRVVLDGYEVTIATHVVTDPEQSLFWKPFADFPAAVAASEHDRLRAAGRDAIRDGVVAGYRAFNDFMTLEYLQKTRRSIGASELPKGAEYYAHRVRYFTTLNITPDEVHRIGLEEVARIRAEMDSIIRAVGFNGDFAAFLRFLRTDPRFYARTPGELLAYASRLAKRADAILPSLFGTLPRQPYGVAPVPDHIAPKYTTGRYIQAAPGGTQPGYYWVNTYNLPNRPLYAMPALTLHEAVPGHHLQMALAQEMEGEGLPAFRRFTYLSAFGEGWGLYSEFLGIEAGMYDDPYAHFGRLTYEMWRACRLVVDTGLHAKGWTRQQALDYLASNTALPLHEVRTETDRYISWPGQALAYKMGELTIRRLRREATQALGSRFDVRAFHDAVLGNGAIPLTVLEEEVRAWVDSSRQIPAP